MKNKWRKKNVVRKKITKQNQIVCIKQNNKDLLKWCVGALVPEFWIIVISSKGWFGEIVEGKEKKEKKKLLIIIKLEKKNKNKTIECIQLIYYL